MKLEIWIYRCVWMCECLFIMLLSIVLRERERESAVQWKGERFPCERRNRFNWNTIRLQLIEFGNSFFWFLFRLVPGLCHLFMYISWWTKATKCDTYTPLFIPIAHTNTQTHTHTRSSTYAYDVHWSIFQETIRGKIDEVKLQRLSDNGSFNSNMWVFIASCICMNCGIDKWKYLHCVDLKLSRSICFCSSHDWKSEEMKCIQDDGFEWPNKWCDEKHDETAKGICRFVLVDTHQ